MWPCAVSGEIYAYNAHVVTEDMLLSSGDMLYK